MRKLTALLICLLMLLAVGCNGLTGDAAHTPEPTDTPVPTAVPTPTPEPRVLFAGEAWKADALEELLDGDGIVPERFETMDALLKSGPFPGLTVAALYLGKPIEKSDAEDLIAKGVRVVVFDPASPAVAGATVIPYAGASKSVSAAEMLERLLAFPPHDTPVRLFGLFVEEGSAAHRAWMTNVEAGKIFAKATYFADGEKALEDWVESILDAWVVGTIDGVFCETVEVAGAFVRGLAARERVDMEVFCVEQNAAWAALQAAFPKLAVCSFQPDADQILAYMAAFIRAALAGNAPPAPPSIEDGWHYSKSPIL